MAVIEGFDFEEPRTRRLTRLLAAIEGEGKILILTRGVNRELYLSGRNLPGVRVLPFGQESPYDVVWAGTVLIEEAALAAVGDAREPDARPRRRPLAGAGAAGPGEGGEEA